MHLSRSPLIACAVSAMTGIDLVRSEEHTSELQSRRDLVCRLLLEIKTSLNISAVSILSSVGLHADRRSLRADWLATDQNNPRIEVSAIRCAIQGSTIPNLYRTIPS